MWVSRESVAHVFKYQTLKLHVGILRLFIFDKCGGGGVLTFPPFQTFSLALSVFPILNKPPLAE